MSKPKYWSGLPWGIRDQLALTLHDSARGHLVISRALYIALGELRKAPEDQQEQSNIEDIEMLIEGVYPEWAAIKEAERVYHSRPRAERGTGPMFAHCDSRTVSH